MKILITGASGFVARHFLDYLSSTGDQHTVAGIYLTNKPDFTGVYSTNLSCKFYQLDLKDRHSLAELLKQFQPEYILHLAARSSVAYSWIHPEQTVTDNNTMFLNILEVMRVQKLSCRLLSVGSSEEYGSVNETDLPLKESQVPNPVNPYGAARVLQQMLIDIYCRNYGLDIIHTRSFNHVGPYQTANFVVSSFTKQAVEQMNEGRKYIDLKVGNIDVVRDFTDVRDVVAAYYQLFLNGKKGQVYNICSGHAYVVKDIISMIEQITGKKVKWSVEPAYFRPTDNEKIIGSYEKLKKDTGWTPKISLRQSLTDLMAYWREKTSGSLIS